MRIFPLDVVVSAVLLELIGLCVDGANIVELCELGDRKICDKVSQLFKKEKEMRKGIILTSYLICKVLPFPLQSA